jgi:hypothetical protein
MKPSKNLLVISLALAFVTGMSGCASSLIGVREGSERVSLADASQVSGCELKRKTVLGVLAKIGSLPRHPDDVEDNLYQLAKNNAVDAGADTVVKGESTEFGKRLFEMYKCRP